MATVADMAWVQSPGWPDYLCQDYSSVCIEIKISGNYRGFDGVLFNLRPLANAGFRDAQLLVAA